MPPREDYGEIRTLLAKYCFAIDERDAVTWAELFTEDGVFDRGLGDPVRGRDSLREFVEILPSDLRHLTVNEIIEVVGDRATVRAYLLVLRGRPPVIRFVGESSDIFTRTADGWRFSQRLLIRHALGDTSADL